MSFINQSLTAVIVFAFLFMTAPASAELNIVLDQLAPQPVEPGQDLTLSVRLENGNGDIENVRLIIVPDSPIKLKNENDRIIDEGRMIEYSAAAETYLLHVDPLASSGEYAIEFRTQLFNNNMLRETNKTIKILVRGTPQLMISNITASPETISPKDKFDIAFSVSNDGTGTAREIQVRADTNSLPFVSLDADTKILKRLDPGESIQLSYAIQVKDRTEISSYSIPIKMDYKDENGENLSSKSYAGIRVLGKADLAISDLKIEPQNPKEGDLITVNMRIENSGTGEARSTKVSIDAPFKGTRTAFLGKIKPDDDAPGVFTFYAEKGGDIPYKANIEFEDDLGVRTASESLNLYVDSPDKNGMTAPIIMGLPIIAGGIYYLHRRKKQ